MEEEEDEQGLGPQGRGEHGRGPQGLGDSDSSLVSPSQFGEPGRELPDDEVSGHCSSAPSSELDSEHCSCC